MQNSKLLLIKWIFYLKLYNYLDSIFIFPVHIFSILNISRLCDLKWHSRKEVIARIIVKHDRLFYWASLSLLLLLWKREGKLFVYTKPISQSLREWKNGQAVQFGKKHIVIRHSSKCERRQRSVRQSVHHYN